MNWDDARVFLAVEREKTLRGAARTLNLDQATVGRRIAALEHALRATLFLRTSEGYALTAAGETALRSAEKMEHSAHELVRRTQGTDTRLAGDVRVTSTDSIALEFLFPAIERLHAAHPEVRVLLDTSTRMLNLAKREADIAVRSVRPDNPDLIARRLARWPMALFASKAYLERHGKPAPGSAFAGHDLVVYLGNWTGSRSPTSLWLVNRHTQGASFRPSIPASCCVPRSRPASASVSFRCIWLNSTASCRYGRNPHVGQSTKSGSSRIRTFGIPHASQQ